MTYKALIFDLDGTAIPNKSDGMPSQRLIDDILEVQKLLRVSVATGRPISNCRHILKVLNIKSTCVIAGGTQLINPQTEETLWKKELSINQVQQIIDVALPFEYQIYISDEEESSLARDKQITKPEQIVYIMKVTEKDTKIIMQKLNEIRDIVAHEVKSWTPNQIDIHITHKDATKKHALEELLKIEKINKREVIAVGDSNNDLPLFEVASYKVAMGNASDKLKQTADYIAPTADADGLAQVIEEKILRL